MAGLVPAMTIQWEKEWVLMPDERPALEAWAKRRDADRAFLRRLIGP